MSEPQIKTIDGDAAPPCPSCGSPTQSENLFCSRCANALPAAKPLLEVIRSTLVKELPPALKLSLKDSTVIEIETSERIFERTAKWFKYATAIIAIPLAILGWFGFSQYVDISKSHERIKSELVQLEGQSKNLSTSLRQREEAIKELEQRTSAGLNNAQLAIDKIQQIVVQASKLSKQGESVDSSLRAISEKLAATDKILISERAMVQQRLSAIERKIQAPKVTKYDDALAVLAKTIWGEARAEGREGMSAIAAVVANRVNKASVTGTRVFGQTVEEVCLRRLQFPAWWHESSGQTLESPSPELATMSLSDPRLGPSLQIARALLAGDLEDPTGGATHYHAGVDISKQPMWARGRTPIARIGNRSFYRDIDGL